MIKSAENHDDSRPDAASPRAVRVAGADEHPLTVYAPPAVLTEGQRLLCLVHGPLGDLAAKSGCARPTICQYRRGDRLPTLEIRRRLHAAFGIPPDAWEQNPTRPHPTASTLRPDDDEDEDDAEDADDLEQDDAEDGPEPEPEPPPRKKKRATADEAAEAEPASAPSALDDYNALLAQLRKQLAKPNLASRERIQISDAFSRALAHKERLERSRELLEARVIKDHPKWKELRAAIIGALLEHPAAARDVEAAITRILGADAERIDT